MLLGFIFLRGKHVQNQRKRNKATTGENNKDESILGLSPEN